MIDRIRQLWARRQLLFIPKQYPKYLNNKLRVFTPSKVLQLSVIIIAFAATVELVEYVSPNEVVIQYPQKQQTAK